MKLSLSEVKVCLAKQGLSGRGLQEDYFMDLDPLLDKFPDRYSVMMVDDDMRCINANLAALVYLTRGRAHHVYCPSFNAEFEDIFDIHDLADRIIEKSPNLVLMDYNMLLREGEEMQRMNISGSAVDKSYKGTDVVRSLRQKGFKNSIFGFASNKDPEPEFKDMFPDPTPEFISAGADDVVKKFDDEYRVLPSMTTIANKVGALSGWTEPVVEKKRGPLVSFLAKLGIEL